MAEKQVVGIALLLAAGSVNAQTDVQNLANDMQEITEDFVKMTCAEFKADLPQFRDNIDLLRHVDQKSEDFERALFVLRKVTDKSIACLK